MKLRRELDAFWNWAGISLEDYAKGVLPNKELPIEWEYHYPNWNRLEKSFWEELKRFKQSSNPSILKNLLEFVGLDNESGTAIDAIIDELDLKQKSIFSKMGYRFVLPQTRWQVAEFLKSDISNGTEFLERMIDTDSDKYVQRRALLSLSKTNPKLACKYALKKMKDTDEYLRLASLLVLKEQNSDRLHEVVSVLRKDPSALVQKELSEISG